MPAWMKTHAVAVLLNKSHFPAGTSSPQLDSTQYSLEAISLGVPEPSRYFLSIPIRWCCHILSALGLELLSQSLQQTELCLQQKSLMGAQKNYIQLLDSQERKWNKWEGLNYPEWQATGVTLASTYPMSC